MITARKEKARFMILFYLPVRVKSMIILGVTVSHDLRTRDRALYALRVLRNLPDEVLYVVIEATIIFITTTLCFSIVVGCHYWETVLTWSDSWFGPSGCDTCQLQTLQERATSAEDSLCLYLLHCMALVAFSSLPPISSNISEQKPITISCPIKKTGTPIFYCPVKPRY